MNYKKVVLDNKLTLLFVPNKKIKLIYINIGVKIGSDIEVLKTLEISHFIEHLFTLLTSNKYSNGLENRNLLSKLNISLDAEVVTKNTNFQYVLKKKYLNKLLDMIANSLYDFTIDEELFINEKNSVIEELNYIINDSEYKFETFVDKSLYKTHTRNYSQEMRLNNVKKVNSNDILDFFKKFYIPENIVISIFGDVNQNKTINLFNNVFNQYKENNNFKEIKLYESEKKYKMDFSKKIYHLKEKKQTCNIKIMFNIPYKFFNDEYYIVFAILNILTFDLSSILINRLRNQEGLIYDLQGQMDLDENTDQLSFVYFETNAESDKIVKVIGIILEELKKLREGKIQQNVIDRYKESLKIKYIRDNLTFKPMKMIDEYTKYLLWGEKIVKFEDEFSNFGNVNKSNITNISKQIFNMNKISIFYNGSKNHDKELKKLLSKNK
jgi:predicted Zn-dependent peptidase